MAGKNCRLIIVDPSLKDVRGHHYALTKVIAASAVNSGYEVLVFSNASVSVHLEMPGAKVKPVFSLSTYDHFKVSGQANKISFNARLRQYVISHLPVKAIEPLKRIRNKLKGFLASKSVPDKNNPFHVKGSIDEELRASMLNEGVTFNAHVLVHTSDAMMYRSILQIIQKPYPGGHPHYHLCTPYDTEIMPHSAKGLPVGKVINYFRLMGMINKHVFLYAENELLAKSLSDEWAVDVATLDIPMVKTEKSMLPEGGDGVVFRVVYLGAARDEKGFNLIPEVIERVANFSAPRPEIEFVIQCNAQIVGYNPQLKKSIERLKMFSEPYLRLITEQQSMEDYYSTLDSADVVLACYQQDRYRVRGSGVATEAVAYGKNLIVTPGTYPEWLAGEAGIGASNSKEIALAIINIANNRDSYKIKAKSRAGWFADKTQPQKYFIKLMDNVDQAGCVRPSESSREAKKYHDDMRAESKYNVGLFGADTSEDGYKLFVKQTIYTDSIMRK